jgi:hypothetical protein
MALYEGHILLLLRPRTVSILSSSTPVIYPFHDVGRETKDALQKE